MAQYSDEDKYRALGLLHSGIGYSEVAARCDMPMAVVLRWKLELKKALEAGNLNDLLDMDRIVLGKVITKAEPLLQEASGKLVESLNHSARLNQELQLTALAIAAKAKMFASSADSSAELISLSETICQLQVAFFNSNSTQINIQNNNGGGTYDEFLSDAPAA